MKIDKVNLKEARVGIHAIQHFEVTRKDAAAFNLSCLINKHTRVVRPGRYTRLVRFDNPMAETWQTCVMSDTDAERNDHREAIQNARERVAINGLGLGMVVQACLAKPEVEHVLVIEKSRDVYKLVAPYYQSERCTIINADAYDYKPERGDHYGMVWHDIWDHICPDNLPEMTRLHRKWARYADWQGSWARDECRRMKRQLDRETRLRMAF